MQHGPAAIRLGVASGHDLPPLVAPITHFAYTSSQTLQPCCGSSNSEARTKVRAFAFLGVSIHYIAYLDEFGHIGPFVSRQHPQHNTSPVFGLGGFVLPSSKVRAFATWFYQLKCNLLQFEIDRDGIPAYQWEKKGAALYTTTNVLRYRELRNATFRLMNRIERDGGMVFYVGLQKTHPPETHNPKSLYRAVLRESIKRIDQFCDARGAHFQIILDELKNQDDFRGQIVSEASIQMFGEARATMIEPPDPGREPSVPDASMRRLVVRADWPRRLSPSAARRVR